jgi:diguanylate cyclase (GGDEF)-like protein
MSSVGALRRSLTDRGWPIAAAGGRYLSYLFTIELITLGAIVLTIGTDHSDLGDWVKAGLIAGLAVTFEEAASRATRLQIRLSADLTQDMTSVWCVAAAVALPPDVAVALVAAVLVYTWLRQQRPTGAYLYRKLFNASTDILGCLGAGVAFRATAHGLQTLPWTLGGGIAIVAAIVVHTIINRSLVSGALLLLGAPLRDLVGSRDENLTEAATLCLGGLVALAVQYQPWLTLLVFVPMVTLQRGALMRTLEAAATIDSKTGMLNAIAWEHVAEKELVRAARQSTDTAILIVDIDRFKMVNDRYGHLVGDAVLRGVGKCLANEVREYDTVARFGGEEFVAVLPGAGDADALVIAERLRSRVSDLRVSGIVDTVVLLDPNEDDWLAVSIGVATSPTDGAELSDLLHAADGALYSAKAAGRNRVLLAERGTGSTGFRVASSA